MAFLGKKELIDSLPNWIDSYKEGQIDNVAYELCLGNEVYLTDSSSGKKEILDEKNSQVVIKPGQFALLLTQETLNIPTNILAFISIKFSQKIKGLVNVSGFHVDPGFKGKIIFSVYNAGPATIVLDKGKPYFMIWFSQLLSDSGAYEGKHKGQSNISAEQISVLRGELASPNILLERIKVNESLLNNLKWASGLIIGLAITISVKFSWDSSKFNEGYLLGIKEAKVNKRVEELISNIKTDSIITVKVDSILKQRETTNDSTKK